MVIKSLVAFAAPVPFDQQEVLVALPELDAATAEQERGMPMTKNKRKIAHPGMRCR